MSDIFKTNNIIQGEHGIALITSLLDPCEQVKEDGNATHYDTSVLLKVEESAVDAIKSKLSQALVLNCIYS